MHHFRQDTPKHRANRRVCKHYNSYKKTLRADFKKRCGYCTDLDTNRIRNYVIDHFIPQKPNGWTHTIQPNQYSNLIYSCPFCNGAKSNKWPTGVANLANDGVSGFIKPTKKMYANAFRRGDDGSIIVHNNHPIGIYIHKELEFDLPIHKLNWKFEKILEQEISLKTVFKKTTDAALKQEINDIKLLRLELVDTIHELYNA